MRPYHLLFVLVFIAGCAKSPAADCSPSSNPANAATPATPGGGTNAPSKPSGGKKIAVKGTAPDKGVTRVVAVRAGNPKTKTKPVKTTVKASAAGAFSFPALDAKAHYTFVFFAGDVIVGEMSAKPSASSEKSTSGFTFGENRTEYDLGVFTYAEITESTFYFIPEENPWTLSDLDGDGKMDFDDDDDDGDGIADEEDDDEDGDGIDDKDEDLDNDGDGIIDDLDYDDDDDGIPDDEDDDDDGDGIPDAEDDHENWLE